MRAHFQADVVDMITEPGMDKLVAEGDEAALAALRRKVEISVLKHGSRVIAIVGHHDCAGNPVSEEVHRAHVRKSVDHMASWNFPVEIIGLWVNERWEVEEVK